MTAMQNNTQTQSIATEIQNVDAAADFAQQHNEPFYLEAEFWVGMAFVLVVVFLAKPVAKALKAFLVKHRDDVVSQITQAEKLRDDAQILLAQYEKKFLNAKNEADAILDKSNREIAAIKENTLNKVEADLAARRKELENTITAEMEKTQHEINELVSLRTVSLVKEKLLQELDGETHAKLIDSSIEKILKKLK